MRIRTRNITRPLLIAAIAATGAACAPEMTAVQPIAGDVAGGTTLTIEGRRFPEFTTEPVQIWLGNVPCGEVTLIAPNKMECTTGPAVSPALVDVLMISPDGFRSILTGGFEYTLGLAVNPTSKTLGPGDSQVFKVTGGKLPYGFAITSGEGSVAAVDSNHFEYTAPDVPTSSVVLVTDAAGSGISVPINTTGPLTLILTPDIPSVELGWDGITYQLGDRILLSASGGTEPYTFTNSDATRGSITSEVYTLIAGGGVTDSISVTDAKGNADSRTVNLNSTLSASISEPAASALAMAAGNTMQFDITASSGVPPFLIETVVTTGTFDIDVGTATARIWTPPSTILASPTNDVVRITDAFGHQTELNISIFDPIAITADTGVNIVEGQAFNFTIFGGIDGTSYVMPPDVDTDNDCIDAGDTVFALCGGTCVSSSVERISADRFRFTAPANTAGESCTIQVADLADTGSVGYSTPPGAHVATIIVNVRGVLDLTVDRAAIVANGAGPNNAIVFTASGGVPFTSGNAYTFSVVSNTTGGVNVDSSDSTLFFDPTTAGKITFRATDSLGATAEATAITLPDFQIFASTNEIATRSDAVVGTIGGLDELLELELQDITYTSIAVLSQGKTVEIDYLDCADAECTTNCAACGVGTECVLRTNDTLNICMDDDDSTAIDIARAVNVDTDAGDLGVTASITGVGRTAQDAGNVALGGDPAALTGGYATDTAGELRYDAGAGGVEGNAINVNHNDDASLGDEAIVTVDGTDVNVLVNDGTTRAATIAASVNSHPIASQLVRATIVGSPDGLVAASVNANLDGATASNVLQLQAGLGAFTAANGLYESTATAETAIFIAVDGMGNLSSLMPIAVFRPVQVAAGGAHSCARFTLGTAGRVKCWGANDRGQLGQGTTRSLGTLSDAEVRSLPFISLTDTGGETLDVLDVVAGFEHTCARTSDPSSGALDLYCWGSNAFGQLGLGLGFTDHQGDDPGEMGTDLEEVSVGNPLQVVAGKYHTCVLETDFQVRCWGLGTEGQLGNGDGTTAVSPVLVDDPPADEETGLTPVFTRIAAGEHHNCGVLNSGKMACWGRNTDNQVGRGAVASLTQIDPADPTTQNKSITWTATRAGPVGNQIVIDYDGGGTAGSEEVTVEVGSGGSDCGSDSIVITVIIDDDDAGAETTAQQVVNAINANTAGGIAAREWISVSLLSGHGSVEQETFTNTCLTLAGGDTAHRDDPFSGANDAVLSPVVTTNRNEDATPSDPSDSLIGVDFTGVTNVIAGRDFSCAVFTNPSNGESDLTCWGDDSSLQRGDDGATDSQTLVRTSGAFLMDAVTGAREITGQVSAGSRHACAILDSGAAENRLVCWGENASGQVGENSTTDFGNPSSTDPIEGITAVATDVAAGTDHTCALFIDGRVYCWGLNSSGQLGTGDATSYGTAADTMGDLETLLGLGIRF